MLITSRLKLRPILPQDAESVFAYRKDAETNRFQSWIPENVAEVDAFIAKNPDAFNLAGTWFQLVILKKENEEIIGDIGVHFLEDNAQCEIGFTLAKPQHGQGFASEAVGAVLDYLFESLNKHRVTASVDPENTASRRLLERLGFRQEAHFKKAYLTGNEWVDDVVYAKLCEEHLR
jgi:RimJ/RimL family protein N-acetyltransferase